jgi:hypothetical protein
VIIDELGLPRDASETHTHTWTIGNTTATNNSTTVTIDNNTSESAYPPYQKVIFIEYNPPFMGGSFIVYDLG